MVQLRTNISLPLKYFGKRLFFLTIPKPLKQYTFLKKIIHSVLTSGLQALRPVSEG